MNDQETIRMGAEAEAVQPVINRAFDKAREALLQKLLGTSPGEPQAILTLHAAIQGIEAARQAVVGEIGAGKLATHTREMAAKLAEQQTN